MKAGPVQSQGSVPFPTNMFQIPSKDSFPFRCLTLGIVDTRTVEAPFLRMISWLYELARNHDEFFLNLGSPLGQCYCHLCQNSHANEGSLLQSNPGFDLADAQVHGN